MVSGFARRSVRVLVSRSELPQFVFVGMAILLLCIGKCRIRLLVRRYMGIQKHDVAGVPAMTKSRDKIIAAITIPVFPSLADRCAGDVSQTRQLVTSQHTTCPPPPPAPVFLQNRDSTNNGPPPVKFLAGRSAFFINDTQNALWKDW
jgi:hypothetical protein